MDIYTSTEVSYCDVLVRSKPVYVEAQRTECMRSFRNLISAGRVGKSTAVTFLLLFPSQPASVFSCPVSASVGRSVGRSEAERKWNAIFEIKFFPRRLPSISVDQGSYDSQLSDANRFKLHALAMQYPYPSCT